ncbi:Hypothetical predicted protein, partial [Scomber scombrus]
VSAPLSTKAQPASLSNPSYHPVQENSTHALKETLVGASVQTNTSVLRPQYFNPFDDLKGFACFMFADERVIRP